MNSTYIVLFLSLISISVSPKAFGKKTVIRSAAPQEIKFLKSVETKYQKQQGLHITLKRKVHFAALGTDKFSTGEAWIHRGKLNLSIHSPIKEKVVVDNDYIWMISPAPKDFKGAKDQVFQFGKNSKRAQSNGLLKILLQGGFLKHFKVVGVEQEGALTAYWLQPGRETKEFKRAQILIHRKGALIGELRFWDKFGNLTSYTFLKTKFNQPLDKAKFDYTPPKDANVIKG